MQHIEPDHPWTRREKIGLAITVLLFVISVYMAVTHPAAVATMLQTR